ncbi:MAG: transcription-repair coupling factor [Pirellulales bacterium]
MPPRLAALPGFRQVVAALSRSASCDVDGAWGSVRALLAAALADESPQPLVIVCPHDADVDDVVDELAVFTETAVTRFPAWEADPLQRVTSDEYYGDRLRVLKLLAATHPPSIVVTSMHALQQPTPSVEQMQSRTRRLRVKETIDQTELLSWLLEQGFHSTSAVELPGEFSSRGGILDLFAPDWYRPVRLELFGDEIESLRGFDIQSQRSVDVLDSIEITIVSGEIQESSHLADHLPSGSWWLLLEPSELESAARHLLETAEDASRLHGFARVMERVAEFGCARASGMSEYAGESVLRLPVESVERFSGDINKVRGELDAAAAGQQTAIVCQTEAEIKRLNEMFASTRVAKEDRLHFCLGRLKTGFRLVEEQLVVISGGELFQRSEIQRPGKRRLGKRIDSFLDLRAGDLVVHLSHGIGRYRGIDLITKGQRTEEHLTIEFDGGAKVYVPASRIGLVQKYIGGSKRQPKLAKIGGKSWLKQKQAAQRAVIDLAVDMLDLQAARQAEKGIRFGPDSEWQNEFDAAFPYHETEDQLLAIDAIKRDLMEPRPMDRLLCGDVGYGKTEVAMRAAFKVADSGYQVAILVPTTILAEQHLKTFQSRMAEFPFAIEALSRFSTKGEQKKIIERLKAGDVDIVIGTHRLAQKDVDFHNLGLVVIDEEQRFGVEVKERLKQYRETVDVLTMTATPIPRTLHMALLGARDISNLETPPEERVAVETRVTRFDDDLIRHAVLRELSRDGQIYFVHNRVKDIGKLAAKLRDIVPEARIRIGHGQMQPAELEDVMVDFVNHKFDLLLATTIVESGLDIPNANTIFIDEADRYGLADLHQLRGRVGRYKHRAYCYLLTNPKKHISPNASRRLLAIEEFSQMGAGFAISMRDLEIRGAGNLLGTEQSGHIIAIGYELYCELLEQTVRKLQRRAPKRVIDVDIALPGEAHLPRDYVPDMRMKLDMYRRLSRTTTHDDVDAVREELLDRFGPPPVPARHMLAIAHLRIDAAGWGIKSIHFEQNAVVFGYGSPKLIQELRAKSKGVVRLLDDGTAVVPLGKRVVSPAVLFETTKSLLRRD